MTNSTNTLGVGAFLNSSVSTVGSVTKSYTLPFEGTTFQIDTNIERFNTTGTAADTSDNWDSYALVSQNGTGATSSTGTTLGGGTQTWGLANGSLTIFNTETNATDENDNVRFVLDTSPGSPWANLAPGQTLTQSITVRATEGGGGFFLLFAQTDADGDAGNAFTSDFTVNFSFTKAMPITPSDGKVDGTAGSDFMDGAFFDAQFDRIDSTDGINDTIYGNAGHDTIAAGAGNDTVFGGADNDIVTAGTGNDSVFGGTGNDIVSGEAGNDIVSGDDGNDTVYGGDGNDTVSGGIGADSLFGGAGNDVIAADAGDDFVVAGSGNDTITGGDGNDTLYGDNTNGTVAGGPVPLSEVDQISLNTSNLRAGSETYSGNSAVAGSSAIFDNVATLADGTHVSARLVVTNLSNAGLGVDLSSSTGGILLNGANNAAMQGQSASFRLEFFNTATGQPVVINPGIVFGDLDADTTVTETHSHELLFGLLDPLGLFGCTTTSSTVNQEALIINSGLTNVGTLPGSEVAVEFAGGALTAIGGASSANDNTPNTMVATVFSPTASLDFTLVSRGANSGFTLGATDITTFNFTNTFPAVMPESGAGNDVIDGGVGNDLVYAGAGNDTVSGGDGNDTLYGGASEGTATGGVVTRESFEWNLAAKCDGDDINGFVQDTGNVNVTFSVLQETGSATSVFATEQQKVHSITDDGRAVNAFSSLDSQINTQGNQADYALAFSAPVNNVSFRINDVDGDAVVRVTAYDMNNNPITVNLTGGSNITLLNTDGVAGYDTADSNGGYLEDTAPEYSVLVNIPGPVSRLVIEHDMNGVNGTGINVTNVYFDTNSGMISATDGGNDVLDGGAGNDVIFGGSGADTVTGGAGDDTLYGDQASGSGPSSRSFSYVNNFDGSDALLGATQTLYGGAPGVANVLNSPDPDSEKEFVFVQGYSQAQEASLAINPTLAMGERVSTLNVGFVTDMGSQFGSDHVDGMSVNFGDMSTLASNREYENGVAEGLAIRLDPLANVAEIRWNGVVISSIPVGNLETRIEGAMAVSVSSTGVVSVTLPGDASASLTGTIPAGQWGTVDQSGWQFGIAGRTGDNAGFIYVDDLNIQSTIIGTTTSPTTASNDIVSGDAGNDVIYGGAGSDTLSGGAGNDTIDGGLGDDDFVIGAGDKATGGSGDDVFTVDKTLAGTTPISVIGGETGEDLTDTSNGGAGDVLDLRGLGDVAVVYGGGNNEAGTATYTNSAGQPVTINFSEIENILRDPAAVDGLATGEVMAPGYTDAQGDQIDGTDGLNDTIYGNAGNDSIDAGLGNDVVDAGAGNDTVSGGTGADSLVGGAGVDTLDYTGENAAVTVDLINKFGWTSTGADTVEGFEVVQGSSFNDYIAGDVTNDTIYGNAGDDNLRARGGDDLVYGGDGVDTLNGNSGNDTLYGGAGNDTFLTDVGDDLMYGGDGDDRTSAGDDPLNLGNDTIYGGAGNDNLDGGSDNDLLDGGIGNDYMRGGLGNDTLIGGAGDDDTYGDDGDDSLVGGDGNDFMLGGTGNDTIVADAGNDAVYGGYGADSMAGGDGNDLLSGEFENDTIDGGTGNDTIDGGSGDDSIIGGFGSDTIAAGTGNDWVTDEVIGNALGGGADTVDLGDGNDTFQGWGQGPSDADLVYAGSGDDKVIVQQANDTVYGGDGNDEIRSTDEDPSYGDLLYGDAGDDKITGANTSDRLYGGTGNDSLVGGAGNDTLAGGDGTDTLAGGAGNDVLFGGLGDDDIVVGAGDVATGGSGDDVFTVDPTLTGNAGITVDGGTDGTSGNPDDTANGDIGDVLDLRGLPGVVVTYGGGNNEAGTATYTNAAGQPVTITFSEIETILRDPAGAVDGAATGEVMGAGYTDGQGDQIDGTDGLNDTILGNAGNDTIDAGLGDDTVDGGADNDSVTGGAGNDSVLGGAGNDTVDGGIGNDTVDGGVGNDVVLGGAGNDTVLGGDGADTVSGGVGNDVLSGGLGDDDILVGGADTATGGSGDDVFTLDPADTATDINAVIDGGTDATSGNPDDTANGNAGDVLDLSAVSSPTTVVFTANPETGTVNGLDGDAGTDISFAEIEKVITGSGNDTVSGAGATGPINVDTGAGNDTIAAGSGNDTIAAGTGDDTVAAGAGDDSVDGGTGNDSIDAGAGNDTVLGGAGNDTVDGGAGDDLINTRTTVGNGVPNQGLVYPGNPALSYPADTNPNDDRDSVIGGAGNDTILTGDDNDTIDGGIGNDVIDAGFDDDIVTAGDGNDTVAGNEGRDTIYGGAGDDVISGALSPLDPNYAASSVYDLIDEGGADPVTTNNTDLLYGGAGNDNISGQDDADTIYGGDDNDTLDGGIDNDLLFGDAGIDVLIGGQGNDTLDGGTGNDSLDGGIGNDSLLGGDGTDTLTGGAGNDTMDGGAGDDDIVVGAGDVASGGSGDDVFSVDGTLAGTSTITVVGGETVQDLSDPSNGGAGDVLDLSGKGNVSIVYNQLDPTWNGTTSESGVAKYLNSANQQVTINFSEIESVVVCFAAGTMIDTAEGEKAIDQLHVGDLVRTADHDYQPIRWIGSSTVAAVGAVAPILIKAGALGNTRDLRVSPQHRMLLGGWQAEMLFGDDEVLVAAKHLVNDTTILRVEGGTVEYFHMLFDTHEIVFAEGAPSESFHPGQEGWGALAEEARAEILALFPELENGQFEGYGASARRSLKAHEAKIAAEFMVE